MTTGLDGSKIAMMCAGEHALYFEWLLSLVGGIDWYKGNERMLARLLEIKFYWLHPLDENLGLHALNLRTEYVSGNWRRELSVATGEPSVLEVLIVLALKVERELMTPVFTRNRERRAHLYFEELLSRIGVLDCDEDSVDEAVDRFLELGFIDYRGTRPTLWTQVNQIFEDEMLLECEEEV